jgi:hypothetical protein
MKALKVILAAALMVAMMVVAVPANAQLGITWTTGFQVQNLSTSPAKITVTFYDEAGAAQTPFSDTVAASGSKTYSVLDGQLGRPNVPANFKGSAVISSDQPVTAILNILGNGTAYGGSANGVAAGSTNVGLPLIQKANGGFDTWFSVQNAGSADASVTVKFTPRDSASGNSVTLPAVTIKPGAARTFDTTSTEMAGLGAKFVGAATVTSTQPVAAIVNQTGLGASKNLLTYDGFGAGSTSVRLPLVQNGNGGGATGLYATGISVQNVGTQTTNITVNFSANTRGSFQPAAIVFNNVAPGQTKTLNTANATTNTSAPGFGGNDAAHRYVGSAAITNSASQQLVAVVNQVGATITGSSYEGFNPANATSNVSLPLLMNANGGFSTAFQCQNVGSAPTTITVNYGANSRGTAVPAQATQSIAAGASGAPIRATDQNANLGRYVGSATVTASGNVPVVCVVNESGPTTGDTLLTYDGTNF